jgi:hypothetical protein
MWALKFIVFFGNNDLTWSKRFSFEIFFINGVFSQIRFNIVKLAQMSATIALIAQTII